MAFEAFDRLEQFRDASKLQSFVSADRLLTTVKDFRERMATLTPEERIDLYDAEVALSMRSNHWNAIAQAAGSRYAEASFANFEQPTNAHKEAVRLVLDYLNRLEMGYAGNLVLIGPPGTGKDHLMFAVIRFAIRRRGLVSAWADGQALFAAVREGYSENQSETPIIKFACRSAVFGLSDPVPANGEITEGQRNLLFRIIDGRYRECRPIITTLNVATRTELDNRLGDSLADRLCHDATVVKCNWPSYRLVNQLQLTG